MACTCLDDVLKKHVEYQTEKHKDWDITDADWLNKGWNLSGRGNPINIGYQIKVEYTFTKVNGQTSQPKSETSSIYGTHCTFCGKKFIDDENPEQYEED